MNEINDAIDAHAHIQPDMWPLERMIHAMDVHGIEKVAICGRPSEAFYMNSPFKKMAAGLNRVALNFLGPVGKMLYNSTVDKEGNFTMLGIEKYKIYSQLDNKEVAEVIKKYPDRFYGLISVNPIGPSDPMQEIEEYVSIPQMIGIKIHPFLHQCTIKNYEEVAQWCEKNKYPIEVHLGVGEIGDYRYLPERFPNLKIIYLHAGVPFFRELWSYAKSKPNIFFDLSSPYIDDTIIREAISFLGADKCLYGTDSPYGYNGSGEDYDYGLIKGWIENMPLFYDGKEKIISDKDKEKILRNNFERLIKRS